MIITANSGEYLDQILTRVIGDDFNLTDILIYNRHLIDIHTPLVLGTEIHIPQKIFSKKRLKGSLWGKYYA